MNFLVASYARSEGGVAVDPSLPLTNAELTIDSLALAYVRAFEIAGQSAKLDVIVPYATLEGTADVAGEPVAREVSGYGDPKLRLSMSFFGAPALTIDKFAGYHQDIIIGGSVQVSLPVGQYDRDKAVNIGTNRWFVKPELGVSKALGPWTLELSMASTFFGDNDDFFGGKRREQDPIHSLQAHLIYSFASGIWTSLSATQFQGGRTTVDGVRGDDLQKSSRVSATLAWQADRYDSIKLNVTSGVSTRTGRDSDTVGVAWQRRWGQGF
jgi:hypothetical protein